ncbi:MAG: N-acetylmuramoyl-L-alanine amidase [Zoogloeaceae bacterium]|jgi:N-acetylmuramoyl-L-alanine amidase|nr:N-acetylmuramoyl-L-alanine amidase [Zoogloeaceae bacterium]
MQALSFIRSAASGGVRRGFWYPLLLLGCLLQAACVPLQPRLGSAAALWRPSPNFEPRRANYVILHHTSNDTLAYALAVLTHPLSGVSSHYLIGRDGQALQLVDESQRAWHAGASMWSGQTDMNSASIGIELDNTGSEPVPPAQIETRIAMVSDHPRRQANTPPNVRGHADIAPERKSDPSALFPWRQLAEAGFGLWCDPPYPPPPENFDALLGLKALGYDTRNPTAAITAFKRHFAPNDADAELNTENRALLYCLLQSSEKPLPELP